MNDTIYIGQRWLSPLGQAGMVTDMYEGCVVLVFDEGEEACMTPQRLGEDYEPLDLGTP